MICESCHQGYMLLFKYPSRWRKCPICAFCVEDEEREAEEPESPPPRAEDHVPSRRDFESDSDLG
jgi:hypothetical protein